MIDVSKFKFVQEITPHDVYGVFTLEKLEELIEGYEISDFRVPVPGDTVFFTDGSVEYAKFAWETPRFILRKLPKVLKVIKLTVYEESVGAGESGQVYYLDGAMRKCKVEVISEGETK